MLTEQFSNIYAILVNIIGLVVCLFRHVRRPRRAWVYAIFFLLGNLLSNYYWGAYQLLMGDYPNTSSVMAYFGWDISYIPLVLLLLHLRGEEERRFFSPVALIPIPINALQFMLYLPFGGIFNNIVQGVLCTAIACLSLNSIVWYYSHRREGAARPYVAWVLLLFITMEYIMWTSSCFDWPNPWLYPYTYASLLGFSVCLSLPWAISRTYRDADGESREAPNPLNAFLPYGYIALTVLCCVGGYLLAIWMRGELDAGLAGLEGFDPYSIIAVILFGISFVLVLFSIAIILSVSFGQKAAESNRLRQAKAVAEQSNAAKTEFLTNMSHEIRTPINAVLGMNEMILRESLRARDNPPQDAEAMREVLANITSCAVDIGSAGNNLLSIVNDILDFSKIEAGKIEIVEGSYSLGAVLNDVSNMIRIKAREKGLAYHVDVDESLPDGLYGDEVRLWQVMINLLNNAVKYTRAGGVTLRVWRENAGEPPAEGEMMALAFAVRDTGIGIRQEDMDKLFAKFGRVDLEMNSTVEGTGLGLAITRNLLDMMGGTIRVESVYGEGSTFTVQLPQKVVSTEPVRRSRLEGEDGAAAPVLREAGFHAPEAAVLIVDDTRMNLRVVAGLLSQTQVQTDAVENGEEAVALCDGKRYDVILMDQRMPGMDGTETMRRIRALESGLNAGTPFICLTADAIIGARERYIAEGFTDYLTKPVDSQALEKLLLKYLAPEKVHFVSKAPVKIFAPGDGVDAFAALRQYDIDPSIGLKYCQDDARFYRSLLSDFALDAEEKARTLQRARDSEDWKDYAVRVHALKGAARTIGADGLADMAAELEGAADKGDAAAVRAGHDALTRAYRRLADALCAEGFCDDAPHGGDDDILEFLPEEEIRPKG